MITMSISELVNAISGKLLMGKDSIKFNGVSIDSRAISPGQVFFAIIGERFDGHDFVVDAYKKGAVSFVVDREIDFPVDIVKNANKPAVIMVEDTTVALQDLASYYRKQHKDLKVVGITGSAGKTSTKDMVAAILDTSYKVKKTEGNLNNYYGLPLTILSLEGDEEVAILEMGMSKLGEIELLTQIASPDIGVITNVGQTHLENLGTVENVARGKSELITGLPETGIAVLNYDNEYVRDMNLIFTGDKVIYYGFSKKADIYADYIKVNKEGLTSFIVNYKNDKIKIEMNKPGDHNIYNALAAIAVARMLDVDWGLIKRALKKVEFSALRWDVQEVQGIKIINDSYNANPLSMKAAIRAVLDIAEGRVITVLGAMLELGNEEENAHYELGKFIYNHHIDYLFTVGEPGSLIAKGARESGMEKAKIKTFAVNEEATIALKNIIKAGDCILIKGSRGMKMEEIVKELHRFLKD